MSYRELLSSVGCQCVVIIEDDFEQGEYKKERALYDITRMDLDDRKQYLAEIESICPKLKEVLKEYLSLFDKCFDRIGDWEENIPRGDITYAFSLINTFDPLLKVLIEEQYALFEGEETQIVYEAGAKYGIGIDHPAYFDALYNDYILCESRARPIRIYTDFSAETQCLFATDIDHATEESSVVCIIDNSLGGTNRAKEVIKLISEKCESRRQNIIGSIFSSKEMFEEISEKMYFEYTSKTNPERLMPCIARSAYNYFISRLKNETIIGLKDAFDAALKNKSIAFFLARKAQAEGASEYEIINDWIKLLSTTTRENASVIKRMICLSKVINDLEDPDELPDASLQCLNTLEAFDYTINDYFLPVAAGDVFMNSKGDWFVLIGQDCDMARSLTRSPKNALAELLPAKIRRQGEFGKWANDLERASIYSFRKSLDAGSEVFQVEYQKRQYIANEIINLCSYNSDGQCQISLALPLNSEQESLMPEYMANYYIKLQNFFSAVKALRIQAEEAFETVIADEYSPRLLSLKNFDISSETIKFDLRRVCRLNHDYVFYLYKLYLEYRGRKPFQTINLIRQEDTTLPVFIGAKKTTLCLTFRSVPVPDKSNRKDWCWIVDATEISKILAYLEQPEILDHDKDFLIDTESIEINLEQDKRLRITKAKQKVILQIM